MTRTLAPAAPRPATAAAGFALLAAAATASALLSAAHLRGLAAPGCGAGAGCGRLLAGAWARLPGLGWPIAFVGAAYFPGLMAAWAATRGAPGRIMRRIAGLGGVGSLGLIGVMLATGDLCAWCLAVHAANLAFLAVLAARSGRAARATAGLVAFGVAFGMVTAGLAALRASGSARAEDARARSERAAIGGHRDASLGFTGRYRLGPESAAARVVLFVDYECGLCAEVERQADALVARHPDVSVSVRHYPLDRACNPALDGPGGHDNACRAARAAEAAGRLGGDTAFFRLHRWLFARRGRFGPVDELREVVASAGLDFDRFRAAFDSDEVARVIADDAREAGRLGILSTPMIFVNGVELKGIGTPEALTRTVDAVLAAAPAGRTAEADRPPTAVEKALADWRDAPRTPADDARGRWPRASRPGAVEVVVWGDYRDDETRALDRQVRERAGRIRYSFRHVPAGPDATEAARAAEAGGRLGGAPGFWAIHAWLMDRTPPFDLDRLGSDLAAVGIAPARFRSARASDAVTAAVEDDRAAAARHGPAALPLLWIDGRWAPRWRLGDRVLLDDLLDAATRDRDASGRAP